MIQRSFRGAFRFWCCVIVNGGLIGEKIVWCLAANNDFRMCAVVGACFISYGTLWCRV